ncbi:hypothetical protein ACTU3I_04955 [Microbacterium sp. RD1]|uniref:hypothetical protein n=1 Tax=Microbacterium sp. RD1 TaxID=3457313 RepID=UPI003FA524BD
MTNADGTWNIEIATPLGRQQATLHIVTDGEALTGTAHTKDESVVIADGTIRGATLTCAVDLTKPLPLKVIYTLEIDGDVISGTAKAGRFPMSKVTGWRA